MEDKKEGMLSPYRVLDLTDEKGLLCGKLLGDLGADVIKIERPGGDPARNIGPFYHDEPDPEKSLFWFAFNTSKRGITLDIETAEGQKTFRRLVKVADLVIESFPLGYMDKLGLGYSDLEKVKPDIIMVSITPFGQTGPYKDYKAPDIVALAMGGQVYLWGHPDLPPVRISHPCQAYLHAGAEAALGALMALYYRGTTGKGQQVDVSIQDSVAQCSARLTSAWDMIGMNQRRGALVYQNVRTMRIWPCQDGHVMWFFWDGEKARRRNLPLVNWMDSEGMAGDFLNGFDWDTLDFTAANQEVVDRIEEPTRKFFMSHTKSELLEEAVKRDVSLYPVSTTKDIFESIQLAAREFWVDVEHPELDTSITYPGPFAKSSGVPPRISRRAPLIGEHNLEIYDRDLNTWEELLSLKQARGYQVKPDEKSNRGNVEKKLLDGVRVVDFGWAITGPQTARVLAMYGAEVIKIEGRTSTDPHRTAPYKDGITGENRSGPFNQDNTGKMSVALNLAHPKGVELAKRFIARADIVIENFAGGVMKRMGLGYEELKKVKPDIIMLSSCMQGQTGPHANHPGSGHQLTALAGFSYVAGWPGLEPPMLGVYTDFIAPHYNLVAILSALDYRRRTGNGQHFDMSAYENSVHFLADLILDYSVNRRVAGRVGNRSPYAAPHGAYRCHGDDRWCAIAVFTDEEWESFCQVIGNPSWSREPGFATLRQRKENEDELDKLVEEWAINYPAEEVMAMMQAAGVAAGVLETAEDLMEHDPQLKHRHFFWELDHPEIGKHHTRGPSFILSRLPCELQRAPLLGEHNEYALKEILGISDEKVAELVIERVVE
ncbi:CaiB/BaiF CoA transferase family protein [Chloroflexota bacterium]